VYGISSWFPSTLPGEAGRWGFHGDEATSLQHFIGTSVRHLVSDHAQNPVRVHLKGLPVAAVLK